MRILWLKSDLLLPLDKGGKLRTWHLLRHLASRHRLTYVCFADPDGPQEHVDGMRDVAEEVVTVPRREPAKRSARFYLEVAKRLLDPLPYAVAAYRSRRYRQAVERLLATQEFDVVVSDFLPPVVNLPRQLLCPAVLFTHNVESDIWRRHAETHRGAMRQLYRSQWRRMLKFERRALRRFDRVLAVSAEDQQTFLRLFPDVAGQAIDVIPTGVDSTFFTPNPAAAGPRQLVFTGSMDWLPNEDAMLHFCRDILPLIHEEEPATTLTIVGREPTARVQRLAGPRVTVTGRVDDVRPYLDQGTVFIVPLRVGGGTRLKIFEAMAMGKAVVSTSVGAEGLPVVDGRDLLLADSPLTFAKAVVHLLRDANRREALEGAARELVVRHYDWSVVARHLDAALERTVAEGRRAPGGPSTSALPDPDGADAKSAVLASAGR
ncbi:MAG: glycosyltransferase [Vicinamibacterales bacterium]